MSTNARASINDSLAPLAFDVPRESAISISLAGDDDCATPSPAVALQHRLVDEFDAPAAIVGRWSSRRTAALVVGFNGVFWIAAIALLSRV